MGIPEEINKFDKPLGKFLTPSTYPFWIKKTPTEQTPIINKYVKLKLSFSLLKINLIDVIINIKKPEIVYE